MRKLSITDAVFAALLLALGAALLLMFGPMIIDGENRVADRVGAALMLAVLAVLLRLVWRKLNLFPSAEEATLLCHFCGYDIRATAERCPECGMPVLLPRDSELDLGESDTERYPLRDDWPATPILPRMPQHDEDAITVHQTVSGGEAWLLQQQLCSRGILAQRVYEETFPEGVSPDGPARLIGQWRVVVWSEDQSLARELSAKLLAGSPRLKAISRLGRTLLPRTEPPPEFPKMSSNQVLLEPGGMVFEDLRAAEDRARTMIEARPETEIRIFDRFGNRLRTLRATDPDRHR